jgi:hypothetical protein
MKNEKLKMKNKKWKRCPLGGLKRLRRKDKKKQWVANIFFSDHIFVLFPAKPLTTVRRTPLFTQVFTQGT